jgi:hypothetical protein
VLSFSTGILDGLTTTQFAALSSAQFSVLTTEQFTHLATVDIAALTTSQAHALGTDNIVALSTDQLAALSSTDIAAMTTDQVTSFTGDQISHMTDAQIGALFLATPVVLDLNGDGVSTTSAAHGVKFDVTGTGTNARYGWTSTTDGLLAIDLNHNGRIDNGNELFGVGTKLANGQHAGNGYEAMAAYDSNGDGVLDAKDAHFTDLVVWVDANHDGVSQAGEVRSLSQLGIVSLDLHGLAGHARNHGNLLGLTSSYTTADGASHAMADVWFAKDAPGSVSSPATHEPVSAPALSDLLAAPATDLLPGGEKAHVSPVHVVDHASAAHLHPWLDARRLDEDEPGRHGPLI